MKLWRSRVGVQQVFTVAAVIICCYGLLSYIDSYHIYLEPYYLHPTSLPKLHQNHALTEKLAKITLQYSDLAPQPGTEKAISFHGLTYRQVLMQLASSNKEIILALIDGAFLQMAVNFYITCLEAFHLKNYLLLAMDQGTCDRLLAVGIHCYVYKEDKSASVASIYLSESFLRKMNIRTAMILDALHEGYSVLHTDVDMFCYKNMLENINCEGDICMLWDHTSYNAGFVYVRPSKTGIQVYTEMQSMVDHNTTLDDQKQLNDAIVLVQSEHTEFMGQAMGKGYQCGKKYYSDPARFFATDVMVPCPECIVVHNNWIVSMEAKVYRAKEMHQWFYNGKEYYSSTDKKYLVYDNPLSGRNMQSFEKEALVNALAIGQILNRIVILPKFHCDRAHCPLNSLLSLADFDKQFGDAYREHTFLAHPLVPSQIRESVYGPVLVKSDYLMKYAGPGLASVPHTQDITPKDTIHGMTDREIRIHFAHVKQPVLHLFALYNVFDRFEDPAINEEFLTKVALGFVESDYVQMRKSLL